MQNSLINLVEFHKTTREKYISATRNFISHWRNREVLRKGYEKEVGSEQTYAASFTLTGLEWIDRISWTAQCFLGIRHRDYKLSNVVIRDATRMTLCLVMSKEEYSKLVAHTLYLLGFIHPFEVISGTGKVVPKVPWSLSYLPYEWTGTAQALMTRYYGQCLDRIFEVVPYGEEVGVEEFPQPIYYDPKYPGVHKADGMYVRQADPYLLGLHHVHTYKVGSIVGVDWLSTRKLPRQGDFIVGLHMPNRCRLCDRIRVRVPLGCDALEGMQIRHVMDMHFQAIE